MQHIHAMHVLHVAEISSSDVSDMNRLIKYTLCSAKNTTMKHIMLAETLLEVGRSKCAGTYISHHNTPLPAGFHKL